MASKGCTTKEIIRKLREEHVLIGQGQSWRHRFRN